MKNKKIINLLYNTLNQPSKSRTRNWVEINDDSHGTYNTNSKINFKSSMIIVMRLAKVTIAVAPVPPPPPNLKKKRKK